jgi:formylglycine-generating enzyme required for sulfatase activity
MILGDRYRAVRFIGEGGFGRTFQAVDEHRLDTPCVIKQFLPQQSGSAALEKATELFKQEAVRLRDLGKHSQIPDLLAFFQQEGRLYLIQEFIDGENLLDELTRKGKFSEPEVKKILIDLLPVLQFIHDNNVIHRDIKPENIIRFSPNNKLFLIDFGVSKEVGGSLLTRVGTITGTPGYAPPEQFRGMVYPNSDIYSLAVTCIRLLTGHLQKADGSDLLFDSMRMQWVWKQYVSVSKDLEIVLDKMLEDLPINRFQTANEVLLELQMLEMLPFILKKTGYPDSIQNINRQKITKKVIPQATNSAVSSNPLQQIIQFISPPTKAPVSYTINENLGNGVILEMVAIPEGKFFMGSPEGEGDDNEKPQHKVKVPPFYMGKYPVTQAQWERIAVLPKVNIDLNPKPSRFKGANLPVEQVSWFDAKEFCARLSKYTSKLYRLPSEAEWEYACRAGTTTRFHFGDTIDISLLNCNNKYGQTTNVGNFPPNAFGLYDMHGNVWEWCEDNWHYNYINAPKKAITWINKERRGSTWFPSEHTRVVRGGSWINYALNCRSAYRFQYSISYSFYRTGLRLVTTG